MKRRSRHASLFTSVLLLGACQQIIGLSDYESVEVCKAAIDRYFAERNEHFRENPRRAGRVIWGEERSPSRFSASNNCKDPRYSF